MSRQSRRVEIGGGLAVEMGGERAARCGTPFSSRMGRKRVTGGRQRVGGGQGWRR